MSKIYRVSSTISTHSVRFVRANNRQAAVNFVARDTLIGNLATQDELVMAVMGGLKIEDASSPQLDMLDMLDDTLRNSQAADASGALETPFGTMTENLNAGDSFSEPADHGGVV